MSEPSFSQGSVRIDADFARFGSKSYSIDKINTVDVRIKKALGRVVAIGLFVWGALFLIIALIAMSGASFIFGVILVVLGLIALSRAKDKFQLFLVTSSSEAQAFESTDEDEVDALRAAVENAMIQQRNR